MSDSLGELKFTNHYGQSAIDLCLLSGNIYQEFDLKVGGHLYSDHFPLIINTLDGPAEAPKQMPKEILRITWDNNP